MATRGCVVLVMPQHWERAILRAELIERGHDVVGMRHLGDLLAFYAAEAGHAPIGVVLVDRTASLEDITGCSRSCVGATAPLRSCSSRAQ